MDELRELLIDKTLAIRVAVETYQQGQIYPDDYVSKVKTSTEEMLDLLESWERFVQIHRWKHGHKTISKTYCTNWFITHGLGT